jgi:hypothetical protein
MYDSSKIVPGIIAFVFVATLPVWDGSISDDTRKVPELELPQSKTQCVRSPDFMREEHMNLLGEWRNVVIREGDRSPVLVNGIEYEKSLTGSCMKCHGSRSQFCDRCHQYLSVSLRCWDCHFSPGDEGDGFK